MKFDIDEVYRDQAVFNSKINDRYFFSAYTPHGIRVLDSQFCTRIRGAKSKNECDEIREDIKNCPHLHKIIKDNLFLNLRNYKRKLPKTVKNRYWKVEVPEDNSCLCGKDKFSLYRFRAGDTFARRGWDARYGENANFVIVKAPGVKLGDEIRSVLINSGGYARFRKISESSYAEFAKLR